MIAPPNARLDEMQLDYSRRVNAGVKSGLQATGKDRRVGEGAHPFPQARERQSCEKHEKK